MGMIGAIRTRKAEAGYDSHTTGTLEASSGVYTICEYYHPTVLEVSFLSSSCSGTPINPSRNFDVYEDVWTLSRAHTVMIGLLSNFGEYSENGEWLSLPIDDVWQEL